MNNITGGLLLALVGFFLGFITYKKYSFFWNAFNTRILRKYLGDKVTLVICYIVSFVLAITGIFVATGMIK